MSLANGICYLVFIGPFKCPMLYAESAFYCSDVYNLAQKLDNSVQIVKITGRA